MKDKSVILVVDDQPKNTELLEAHLVPQGYEVVIAASGEEALKILSGNQIDLVLLDVMMPGMSGFEVLEKMRADKKTRLIPVVMVTVLNETEDRVKALEAGCDDFISKPFDRHELLVRVKSLLRIKSLHDEIEAAREYAESIINTVREPLISLDQDLRVVTVSRSFCDFFKVKPEETVGQLIYNLGNKQWDIPKLRELLETILPEKTTFDNYEVEHDFATIGRRIMLLNARQIERGEGKERIILLAIEDITDRSLLKDILEESESRYRRVFETATDGIVLLEKSEGHIVQANQAAVNMLGYSEAEYVGKMLKDIGVPIDMNDFPKIMESLNKSGILNYEDVPIKSKSGKDVHADVYLVNRSKLAQCNIRDVSERKLADKILKEEKKFIENALNTMKDIFFVFDLEGGFLRWNKTMNVVTGYTDREISLKKVTDFFREDEKERVSEAILKGIEEGSASVEAIVVTKDNRQIPYAFNASRLSDTQNQPIGISGFGRDITEHRRLESQLRHAQKMEAVGTLAGGIAHDFNNILNAILGYGNMVAETLEAGSPVKENMNEVLIAADRASELARKLLVFSRKDVVNKVMSVDINEIIRDLEKMLTRIIRESIEFNIELVDMPLTVLADAGHIEQVLINLAVNAKDAMHEGGRLTISTGLEEVDDDYVATYGYGKPGRYCLITVTDTGQGMDAETQKKIFEPFFTTKGIGKGTGLGLAICYGIIKQYGGYTNVYSEPGQGTVFKIYLPLSEETATMEKDEEAAAPVKHGNETVLVAEDDASLRKLGKIVLESFGYSVITAVDGEDAIVKFMENRERINIVMVDMIMPKKNGKEVGEAIRKVSPGVKILFASGYTMDIIKGKELVESGSDFIHKPFTPKDLLIKVREMLDR